MPRIAWRDEYSVGNPAVDHEHRELIDLVAALQERIEASAAPEVLEAAFGDLLRGISAHFALEESFMRRHAYDAMAGHKADHERLLDDLRDIMDGGAPEGPERLAARLESWFAEHFRTHDARLHGRLGSHHDEPG
jgi:hemerythrin-like metal-binding protein